MTTTTVRLPAHLKIRLARAAKHAEKTPHAFIVDAIAEATDTGELQFGFAAEAKARFDRIAASGKTLPWSKVRAYLEAQAAGATPSRPTVRSRKRAGDGS